MHLVPKLELGSEYGESCHVTRSVTPTHLSPMSGSPAERQLELGVVLTLRVEFAKEGGSGWMSVAFWYLSLSYSSKSPWRPW